MKNKNFEKKLRTYSLLATGVIGAATVSDAQIIYTDVIPDDTIHMDSTRLNLNRDGLDDFYVKQVSVLHTTGALYVEAGLFPIYYGAEILGHMETPCKDVNALNYNDVISNNQNTWGIYPLLRGTVLGYGINYGDFKQSVDKYAGVRIDIGGQWHYGWIRLNVRTDATKAILKDYAYNTIAGQQILAGQTIATGVASPSDDNLSIYVHNKTMHINFVNSGINKGNIVILNLMGQEVMNFAVTGKKMEINLQELNAGIYIANIQTEKQNFSKKFNVE